MPRTRSMLARLMLALGVLAMLVVSASPALAMGRVKWKSTHLKERSNKSWRIEIEIHLPRPPDMAHMPVKFEFKPVVYYERAMIDGHDEPVERKVPLHGRQSMFESVDVGFMDPSRGTIEKRTKFSFKVTRAHGYEAGEYQVTIRDARTGGVIGGSTRVYFEGENEIIDRRAIVFAGDKKKKKDEAKKEEAEPTESAGQEAEPEAEAEEGQYEPMPEAEDPFVEEGTGDEPPPVDKKNGGCGCRLDAQGEPGGLPSAFALFSLLLVVLRRRNTP